MFQEPHVLEESGSVHPGREDERGARFPPTTDPLSAREHIPQRVPTHRLWTRAAIRFHIFQQFPVFVSHDFCSSVRPFRELALVRVPTRRAPTSH
jgi:hypothetical protein